MDGVIISYRDGRTADFAAGKRVKALTGIDRPARLKLDRVEAAHTLKDRGIARQSLRGLEGRPKGPVQHSDQRPMADLL